MTDTFETVQAAEPANYIPPFYNNLDASLSMAWSLLQRGTTDRRSAFHAPAVASIGVDGSPQQRTMVLRKVDPVKRTLRFNTDARSQKWQELAQMPHVSVLAYSAWDKIQVRLSGFATLDRYSALAESVWISMRDQSRVAYAQPDAPGATITEPDSYVPPLELRVDDAAAKVAREHFCLLTVEVETLDWVYLNLCGNRRAQFRWPDGVLESHWLAP